MSDTIYIKTGALGGRAGMPALAYDEEKGSEIGYRSDTNELYIGSANGNIRLCGGGDVAGVNALLAEISTLKTQIADIITRLEALEE